MMLSHKDFREAKELKNYSEDIKKEYFFTIKQQKIKFQKSNGLIKMKIAEQIK
jgi:hypothetical protein